MATASDEAQDVVKRCLRGIGERAVAGGGFSGQVGGVFRPDATAWAVVAMRACGVAHDRLYPAREKLAATQAEDGSVALAGGLNSTVWPTPLAILAWHGSAPFSDSECRALDFLLAAEGVRWERRADENEAVVDPRLRGWPWVTGTFSWVEPTALSMLALTACGHRGHPRCHEAVALLMDRQVSAGGWNFGGTRVYRAEHAPLPETTGLVLVALSDRVPRDAVEKALAFARASAARLRTPLSLAWCLLGLAAWGDEPDGSPASIMECLDRESRYGGYDTTHLALLALASIAKWTETGPLFSGSAR